MMKAATACPGGRLQLLGAALALALASSGCAPMVETTPVVADAAIGCSGALPGYRLPGRDLRLTISPAQGGGYAVSGLTQVAAGRGQLHCLDYIANAAADDKLLARVGPSGLLQFVGSEAADQTPAIAQRLIETAANVVIAGGLRQATQGRGLEPPLPFAFDPFNPVSFNRVREALRPFGLCLAIEGVHVPEGGADLERFCAHRGPIALTPAADLARTQPIPAGEASRGILYRPLMSHMVTVLRQRDPGRGPWLLHRREAMEFPDLGPIVSISIERAAFATRKTRLTFNEGVLTDVAVEKGSELAGFAQIPLDAAKQIVAIPGQIVTLRITLANENARLIQLRTEEIKAQEALLKARRELDAARAEQQGARAAPLPPARAASGPNALADSAMDSFISGCVDAGNSFDSCMANWRQVTRR